MEKQLPGILSFIHPRYETPTWSLLFFSGVTLVVSVQGSFLNTLSISVIVRVLIFLFVCAAMLVLRRKETAAATFTLRYGMFTGILAILFSCWLLSSAQVTEIRDVCLCMLAGALFYVIYQRKKS